MQTFLKVLSVDNRKDVNDRPYQLVQFEQFKTVTIAGVDKIVKSNMPSRARVLWGPDPAGQIKEDGLFGNLNVGDIVDGHIQTFNTTPYTVGERSNLTTYTCVVFEGENGVSVANRNLRSNNAAVVDEHGQITSKVNTPKPVPANGDNDEDEEYNKKF